jgi:hypothetical protein
MTSFWPLLLLLLFFKRRISRKKKKKKRRKSGVAGQNGMVQPPHFWPRDGWSHPHGQSGGGRATPMAKGVVGPPPKGQKKKKKGRFWAFGCGWTTPKGLGPKAQNLFIYFFLAFCLGMGVVRLAVGVAPATPWPKMA